MNTKETKKSYKTKSFKYTPEELRKRFDEYVKQEGYYIKQKSKVSKSKNGETKQIEEEKKYELITIVGLCKFLNVHSKYLYELPESYDDTKDYINNVMEDHVTRGISRGDIAQSFGIFYLKNKFKYTDKQEVEQTNFKREINIINDLSDEELEEILNA